MLGLAGAPGSGKSTVAQAYVDHERALGTEAAVVPMDGFHLADATLRSLGLLGRKGAPETFDAWGYAALLARLRSCPPETVYVPGFERDLEQPIAAAIAVPPGTQLVVTEGNYLLLDQPQWRAVRDRIDEVWFVHLDDAVRRERLVARHIASGKSPAEARAWVHRVDEPNARLVEETRAAADRVVDVTGWDGQALPL